MNFSSLKHYIIFMRYKRSGSALLANLIDAHPQAVFVRNEELFAKYPRWKGDKTKLYSHLYNMTTKYREKPFYANGYTYPIDGVGYAKDPVVIGHKSSTRRFLTVARDKALLDEFQQAVGLPFKFLHLIRSPYDQVNARWQQKEFRRVNAPVDKLIEHVREQTEGNVQMRQHAGEEYTQVYYENLKENPMSTMATVCSFLGLPVKSDHLINCKKLITQASEKEATTWTKETREAVRQLCEDYPEFYKRYL